MRSQGSLGGGNDLQSVIAECFSAMGLSVEASATMTSVIIIAAAAVLCLLANLITKKVLLRLVKRIVKHNKYTWDDKLYKHKVFHRLAHCVTPLIISFFADCFPDYEVWIRRIISAYLTVVILFVIDSLLNAADEIYSTFDISRMRPIKGILQVLRIISIVIGLIVIVSCLTGQNPLILIGSLGALSAVLLLVFQSSILGFVAGIQLTSNDMVRIGDWIQMPKYDADGIVTELTLTTVKVRNFDNSITTIPAQAMVNDSFRNWRTMTASGVRRIARSISIDISSICFCTGEMLDYFSKIEYLKDYISDKQKEIDEYNRERNIDVSIPVNGRRMTNIGTFRFYVENYLANHPGIRRDMKLVVRQLSPTSEGLPLEICAFANTSDGKEYEKIQSDIFDHLFAVLPQFGLRAFQKPSGYDITLVNKNGASG